jgi:transketolase
MRSYFAETMMDLAKENEDIIYLAADLMGTLGMQKFEKEFPQRAINTGIAEANMIGMAAGLSAAGKIPFAHSFGPFATRRVFDQVFLSCAYARLNVKIVGSDPGVCAAYNGGTHMPFEDVGIMRTIPNITIVEPSDSVQLRRIIRLAADRYGVFYIRLPRKITQRLYTEDSHFCLGRAARLREGGDVALIAGGIMVAEALKAADMLAAEGIEARVLDMFTVKPLDNQAVMDAAVHCGAIVSCENHNVINGLGAAISQLLALTRPTPMEMVGVADRFGEVGAESYLRKHFGLTAEDIAAAARRAVIRKKG